MITGREYATAKPKVTDRRRFTVDGLHVFAVYTECKVKFSTMHKKSDTIQDRHHIVLYL